MPKDTTNAARVIPVDEGGYAQGRTIGGAATGQRLPNFKNGRYGDRTRLFLYGAHHSSWEVVEIKGEGRLVPVLKPLYVVAGCNGTRGPGSGLPDGAQPSPADVQARAQRNWGVDVLLDMREYLVELDGVGGQRGIFAKWERVRIYADGAWDLSFDHDAFNAWRWGLVTSGKIERPRDSAIAGLRSASDRRISRAGRREDSPAARRAVTEAEKHRALLDQAIAALAAPKGGGAPKLPKGMAAVAEEHE